MPWTAQGPYSAGGNFTNANANNIELQYSEATLSFEQDLLTPFVITGMVASKNGVTATQLDVTAGVAFLRQSDATLRRRNVSSSTQSTVGHPSTTMWLFLNPDGTFSFQTSSTPPTNALAIAHCTTDGSSNILVVTDDRVLNTSVLSGMAGHVDLPSGSTAGGSKIWTQANDGSGSGLDADLLDGKNASNASGDIPVSNGTVCTNLNADLLDGHDSTYFAPAGNYVNKSGDTMSGTLTISGGSIDVGNAVLRGVTALTGPSSNYSVLNAAQASPSGIRFSVGGSAQMHIDSGGNLVVNGGFTFGSGGADDAEMVWTDDLTIGAGDVVCWDTDEPEDSTHGGCLVRCTHADCAAAGIISTAPASIKAGRLIAVMEEDPETGDMREQWTYDDDPHWKPLTMQGRVPVRVVGAVSDYRPGMPLVSAGDGRMRAYKRGDKWPRAVVASIRSDVQQRPLAAGCVLVQVR